jgi:hypothetical protein
LHRKASRKAQKSCQKNKTDNGTGVHLAVIIDLSALISAGISHRYLPSVFPGIS